MAIKAAARPWYTWHGTSDFEAGSTPSVGSGSGSEPHTMVAVLYDAHDRPCVVTSTHTEAGFVRRPDTWRIG
jgi:hypothetical protein